MNRFEQQNITHGNVKKMLVSCLTEKSQNTSMIVAVDVDIAE